VWSKQQKKDKRDWNKVYWSDEVTFHVGENRNVYYVTRGSGSGEEWLDKNLVPSFKSGRTAVGVWSCYCGDEMGPLVIVPKGSTMTAERYLETVKKHFVPFYRRIKRKYGNGVVIQKNNAPWHTAKVVRAYWKRIKIPLVQWPAQSPDLSPIKNLWRWIKCAIGKQRHRIKNIGMMERALEKLWPTIDRELLTKLNESMERRLALVIKNKGGTTKY